MSWLLEAFWELSTDRQSGFGVGWIPFVSIVKYCDETGITDYEQRVFFRRAMREADSVFVRCVSGRKSDSNVQVSDAVMTDANMDKILGD